MNLKHLNEMQASAVTETEGPLLILAGAGSGKTRVLTHRIAYLIEEKNIFPSNILAITFTNKAASEMKARVEGLIGDVSGGMWIGTFHSTCVKMLRKDADKMGYTRDFVIYDPSDQMTVMKDCYKELDIDEKKMPHRGTLSRISEAKNELISPDEYLGAYGNDFHSEKVAKCYALYQKKLSQYNAMDFDDLIGNTVMLFKEHPEVLDFYKKKFKYLMVDEYQDTNKVQYLLVSLLASGSHNLCVVGDNDQSIYGWRGADVRNIRDFEKDFPGARIVKLEQNYRSCQNILDAANQVIQNNRDRKEKNLWTENDKGESIKYYKATNEYDEARFIANQIISLRLREKKKYGDFAILYRTNAQSRVFEETMMREGVPYRLVGGLKFYERKEIKDMMAYLKVVQNPADEVSISRIINVPRRGIGDKTLEKIKALANDRGIGAFEAIQLGYEGKMFTAGICSGLRSFMDALAPYIEGRYTMSVSEIFEGVLKATGYIEELQAENTIEARSRVENIRELASAVKEFENRTPGGTLSNFLEEYCLKSDIDSLADGEDGIVLMTLHSAKGLEFPVVFLSGLEETVFPTSRSFEKESDMEEERRLAYVGITRAEELLYLTHATVRMLYGRSQVNGISRFIREIPESMLEGMNEEPVRPATTTGFGNGTGSSGVSATWGSRTSPTFSGGSKTAAPVVINAGRGVGVGLSPSRSRGAKAPAAMVPKGAYGSTLSGAIQTSSAEMDYNAFTTGTKVVSENFGDGTIITTVGEGADKTATVAFRNKGIKKLKLSFANLKIADSGIDPEAESEECEEDVFEVEPEVGTGHESE